MGNPEEFDLENEDEEMDATSPLDSTLDTLDQNNPLVLRLKDAGAKVKNAFYSIAMDRGLSLSSIIDVEDEETAEGIISELERWMDSDPSATEDEEERARFEEERELSASAVENFLEQDVLQ